MFVVSDKGDILSLKNAPETTAPAAIDKENHKAVDIPIKASTTVPTIVSELPTLITMKAVTTNIIAKKYFGVTSSNPPYISVGIVPASIQEAIKIPIIKNKKTAAMPAFAPSTIPDSSCL